MTTNFVQPAITCPICNVSLAPGTWLCPDCGEDLSVLIRLQQAPIILYNEGLAYARAGDFDRALMRIQESIAAFPDNPSAYVVLGKLYAQQGQLDLARNTWEAVLERWPNAVAARQAIAAVNKREQLRQAQRTRNASLHMRRRRFEIAWSFVLGGLIVGLLAVLLIQFQPTTGSTSSLAMPTPTAIMPWTPTPRMKP